MAVMMREYLPKKHGADTTSSRRRFIHRFAIAGLGLLASAMLFQPHSAVAQPKPTPLPGPLPPPAGPVILSITGAITVTNADQRADFDLAMLEDLGLTMVETETDWTQGLQRFEGPLLRHVLARVGAVDAKRLEAKAVNNYRVTLPANDAQAFDVILALKQNGDHIPRRGKGPIWVVYPETAHPKELNRPAVKIRWIWQLRELAVQ